MLICLLLSKHQHVASSRESLLRPPPLSWPFPSRDREWGVATGHICYKTAVKSLYVDHTVRVGGGWGGLGGRGNHCSIILNLLNCYKAHKPTALSSHPSSCHKTVCWANQTEERFAAVPCLFTNKVQRINWMYLGKQHINNTSMHSHTFSSAYITCMDACYAVTH